MSKVKTKQEIDQQNAPSEPFQVFEDLAQKLVAVPKEEIDQAEKNEKRRKKRQAAKQSS